MMWRSINLLLLVAMALLISCSRRPKTTFTYRQPGYYYQLLSFNTDTFHYRPQHVALVAASFKTQSDSVFWDSYNNLSDRFYIRIDSSVADNAIRHYVSRACVSDSVCLFIKPSLFFKQQFGSDSVPFFSRGDTAVKVYLKLKQLMSPTEFEQLNEGLRRRELAQIESYFGSPKQFELARDPQGFYWISKPIASALAPVEEGDQLTLAYSGYFLNGRLCERSAGHFDYIYGTPDQLLKGLNYVTGKLKLGQTAKILLPSRLAFGESGSSNGVVPPFTPLIYELTIIDVKKTK